MSISTQSLVSSIVPRPYFKRIVLESGTNTYKHLKKENPHIDPLQYYDDYHQAYVWKGGWGEGKSGINPGLDNLDPVKQLNVTVEIVLKDIISPTDPAASWFKEEGYKYLTIGVLQVTNLQDIETLSNMALSSNDEGEPMLLMKLLTAGSHDAFPEAFDKATLQTPVNTFLENRQRVNLSWVKPTGDYDMNNSSDFANIQNITTVHGDGRQSYDIPVKFDFGIPNTINPNNLCYFAAVSFDKEALLESDLFAGIEFLSPDDPFIEEIDNFIEMSSEMVIKNGSTIGSATVFKIAESGFETTHGKIGDIWGGPVHYKMSLLGGGWYPGKESETPFNEVTLKAEAPILEAQTIPNYTVQDFRKLLNIENANIDLSIIKQDTFTGHSKIKLLSNDESAISLSEQNYSYFSDAWMSRGQPKGIPQGANQRQATFMFAVDYESLLIDNFLFSNLYLNSASSEREKIKGYSPILSMKLLRRRVKKNIGDTNKLGTTSGEVPHTKNTPEDVIGFAHEKNGQLVVFNITDENPGQTGMPKTIKEITFDTFGSSINNPQPGNRFFACMDPNIFGRKQGGHYQYGVEMEIKDGSVEYFKNEILSPFLESIAFFEKYYSKASLPGNFDATTNKFTNKFILGDVNDDDIYNVLDVVQWTNALTPIMRFISLISPEIEALDIMDLIFPVENTTLKSIGAFVQTMKTLAAQLIQIHDSVGQANLLKLSKNESALYNVSPTPSSSNTRKTFKVKDFFEGVFDAEREFDNGYSFIQKGLQTNTNLIPTISAGGYANRIKKATLSVFKNQNVDITGLWPLDVPEAVGPPDKTDTTKWTYLTPQVVCLSHMSPEDYHVAENPPFVGNNQDHEYYKKTTEVLASIMKYNYGINRVGGHYLQDNYLEILTNGAAATGDLGRFKILDILEEKNCHIAWEEPEQDSGNPLIGGFMDAMIDSGLKGIEPLLVALGGKELNLLTDQLKLSSYDPNDLESKVRKSVYGYHPDTSMFPNQLKALTQTSGKPKYDWFKKQELPAGSGQFFNTGLTWKTLADFILRHMIIVQVQAFTGFNRDMYYEFHADGYEYQSPTFGRNVLKKPIWTPLTRQLHNQYLDTGNIMLCRLVPYEATFVSPLNKKVAFKFKQIKSLQLPIYNKHFMIQF